MQYDLINFLERDASYLHDCISGIFAYKYYGDASQFIISSIS